MSDDTVNGEAEEFRQRWPGRKVAVAAGWSVLVLAVLIAGWWQLFFSSTPVAVVQPQRGELREEVFGTGTLESKVVVGLSAKMIGKVAEVLVDQGDTVITGQTLARLEAKDFEDAVRAAEASLVQAKAELAKAQVDLKRDRDLLQGKFIPQSSFDASETACQVAEARVKNSESQLDFARARLADTRIVSPVAGLVITRNLEAGSTVVPGASIFRVAETSILWVQAMVDEREAGKLRIGQPARIVFRADPNQSYPGKVSRLSREADRVTEERGADISAERLPPEWFIGMKADVYVETARKDSVLQIPAAAIVSNRGQAGVFVVSDGRAIWKPIILGLVGRDAVEVVSGAYADDQVIVNPYAGKKPLTDGQRVAAVRAEKGS